jgi:hypothetical protein
MQQNSRTKRPKRNSGKQGRAHGPQLTAKQVAIYWQWLREANAVAQVVPSDQLRARVQRLNREFDELGSAAVDAMRYELEVKKNGRIGHQILREMGVIPSPAERIAIAAKPGTIDKSTLTPFELAVAEDEYGQINGVAYGMACAIEESARIYGTPLPTAEEHRRLRRIAEDADELSGGRFHEICNQGGPEENRVRQLAEDAVKRDEARTSSPMRTGKRSQDNVDCPFTSDECIAREEQRPTVGASELACAERVLPPVHGSANRH